MLKFTDFDEWTFSIFQTRIALRLRIIGEKQIVEGEIADLKFYLCEFNPARRNATKHFIIQPCTLSLHGNTPESRGMSISLSTNDIRINISPAIIELLSKAMATVTATEDKSESIQEEFPDYSDLWKVEKFKEDDFWFMRIEQGEEVVATECAYPSIVDHKPEVCIVEIPSIVIVIETGFGYYTYPMLVIETKMNAEIRNWSSSLSIDSSMTLGMAYYNSTMAVWEPLIEPNEREKSNGVKEYQPWELNFNLKIEKPVEDSVTSSRDPKTKISIASSDTLEVSVTKTCLDVLQDLGQAFSDAIRPEGLNKPDVIAPFIVQNDTGFDVTLDLKSGSLNLHSTHFPNSNSSSTELNRSGVVFKGSSIDLNPNQITTCTISPGGKAYLQPREEHKLAKISAFGAIFHKETNLKELFLHCQVSLNIEMYQWDFFLNNSNVFRLEKSTKTSFYRFTKPIDGTSHCTETPIKSHGESYRMFALNMEALLSLFMAYSR